jgi:SAM-dependent methyltransferase
MKLAGAHARARAVRRRVARRRYMRTKAVALPASAEFHISPFAEFYEQISDSFIDTRRAAESLKRHLRASSGLFEIGLGTGYFASLFTADGYTVSGIQPRDEMLPILKRKHPDVKVVAECKLEDYQFTERHETIVSHSSVFLFTTHEVAFGHHGETLTTYIFQSFVSGREKARGCLRKSLRALAPGGRLFINIQNNPMPFVAVGDRGERLTFEMLRCDYFLEVGRVEKTFRLTHRGHTYLVEDSRYCETYSDITNYVSGLGFTASISEDRQWVVLEHIG